MCMQFYYGITVFILPTSNTQRRRDKQRILLAKEEEMLTEGGIRQEIVKGKGGR